MNERDVDDEVPPGHGERTHDESLALCGHPEVSRQIVWRGLDPATRTMWVECGRCGATLYQVTRGA